MAVSARQTDGRTDTSFATALGLYLGARNRGKRADQEAQQQNAYQQGQLGLQRDEFEQRKTDAAQRADLERQRLAIEKQQADAAERERRIAAGLNPDTGERVPFKIPASLTQIAPNNKGHVLLPAVQAFATAQHYQSLAAAAQQQGAFGDATFYANAARDAALNANSLANAGYTSGVKTALTDAQTDLTRHRVPLVDAQAAATRDMPNRIREVAAGHDAATLQRAQAEITNRTELAHYNGNVRAGLVQLAGAYRASGSDVASAVRLAIADLNNGTRMYLGQTDPRRTILGGGDPGLTAPTGGVDGEAVQRILDNIKQNAPPGVTINIDRQGVVHQTPASQNNNRPRGGNGGTTLSENAQQQLAGAQKALQNHVPLDTVLSTLEAGAAAHGLTPQDVQAIRAELTKQHLKPLPLNKPAATGWGTLNPLPVQSPAPKRTSLAPLPILPNANTGFPPIQRGRDATAPFLQG